MNGFKRSIPVVFGFLLTFSCGTDEVEETDSAEIPQVQLAVSCSIGMEAGDSNYVFGTVMRVDHDSSGNILVLDRLEGCIKVYESCGNFVREISREGSGPGELMNPLDMTVTESGEILVETPWSGGLHSFSVDGEWLGLVTPFYNNPPTGIWGADGKAYVAVRNEVIADEEGNLICTPFIGRYDGGEEPVVKYWEDRFPFDPGDLPGVLRNGIRSHAFCADRDGNVFMARYTSEEYRICCFSPDGELFLEIREEPLQVAKTLEEIAEEEYFVESSLRSAGSSGVTLEYTAEPLRDTIAGLGVDGQGRIWVHRGTERIPTLDVYDYRGELLFTATVPEAGNDAFYWKFIIDEHGILAYSVNPEVFQQVFVLELS